MTPDSEVLQRLEACILSHCSRIGEGAGNRSATMANHMLIMAQNSELAAQSSTDAQRLEKLEESLSDARDALRKLSTATVRELNYAAPEVALEAFSGPTYAGMGAPSRTRDSRVVSHRLESITSLLEGIRNLRKAPAFQKQSSQRRNYRAACVAAACLKVWREEISPEEPPSTLNANRETALSRFIGEVFDILSIGATPTSALNGLKDLGGEQALILSIAQG